MNGTGQKLARQSTLYDEQEMTYSEYADYYGNGEQSYDETQGHQYDQYAGDGGYEARGEYSSASYEQQQYDESGGYDYNYDYNYGYSEGQSSGYKADGTIDDGSESHGYGYYDETGYYYDGQWYSYDGTYDANYSAEDASNWPQQQYEDYEYDSKYEEYAQDVQTNETPSQSAPSQRPTAGQTNNEKSVQREDSRQSDRTPQNSADLYAKRRTMLNHGDLSSSGGSVDSEQPALRRGESNASVATPTAFDGTSESPVMMGGELDRLQSDLMRQQPPYAQQQAKQRMSMSFERDEPISDYRHGSPSTLGQVQQQQAGLDGDLRRASIQSRLSQQSRRENFRRRRSSSICSERDPEYPSPYQSYDEERTPVNEMSFDGNDLTPVATQMPFPQQQYKNSIGSFENEQVMDQYRPSPSRLDTFDDPHTQIQPPPTPPTQQQQAQAQQPEAAEQTPQDATVVPQPPQPEQHPCKNLTPRQKWLWAFNKVCAQLVSQQSKLSFFSCMTMFAA